jgi:HTH-type transcriptional regulator/antitoxin HigA
MPSAVCPKIIVPSLGTFLTFAKKLECGLSLKRPFEISGLNILTVSSSSNPGIRKLMLHSGKGQKGSREIIQVLAFWQKTALFSILKELITASLLESITLTKWFGSASLGRIVNTTGSMPLKFRQMTIKPIKNRKDYRTAMERLEVIFDARPGTSEGDELEVLSILIEKYENEHFPVGMPDPIEAIRFRMEQLGYNQADLAKVVGLKSRVSEILNRKRKLTLEMIRQLHDGLNIPTDVLIQSY